MKPEPGYQYQFSKREPPQLHRIHVNYIEVSGNILTHYALVPAYMSKRINGRMAIYPNLLRDKWGPVEDRQTVEHRLNMMFADSAVDDWKVKRVPLSSELMQSA